MKYYMGFMVLVLAAIITFGVVNANPVICYKADSAAQSGVTMGLAGSGVSLCGVIDLGQINTNDLTIGLTPGTITFSDKDENTDQGGTGGSACTGVTTAYRWAVGNENVSTAKWEGLGITGTTAFNAQQISGNTPYTVQEDTIEAARYLAIFQEPCGINTGVSQWLVSTPRVCFH